VSGGGGGDEIAAQLSDGDKPFASLVCGRPSDSFGKFVVIVTERMGHVATDWQCRVAHELKQVVKGLLQALVFLHDNCGIVHRDVSPGNVGLNVGGDGNVRVALFDLGMATFIERGPNRRCGTNGFIAPEVEASDGKVPYDARADVFSAGKVIEHVMGRCTFSPDTKADAVLKKSVSDQVRAMVTQDAAQRPTSRQALDMWMEELRRMEPVDENVKVSSNRTKRKTPPQSSHPPSKTGQALKVRKTKTLVT